MEQLAYFLAGVCIGFFIGKFGIRLWLYVHRNKSEKKSPTKEPEMTHSHHQILPEKDYTYPQYLSSKYNDLSARRETAIFVDMHSDNGNFWRYVNAWYELPEDSAAVFLLPHLSFLFLKDGLLYCEEHEAGLSHKYPTRLPLSSVMIWVDNNASDSYWMKHGGITSSQSTS